MVHIILTRFNRLIGLIGLIVCGGKGHSPLKALIKSLIEWIESLFLARFVEVFLDFLVLVFLPRDR